MSLGETLFETLAEMMGIPVRKQPPKRQPPPRRPDEDTYTFPGEVVWGDSDMEDDAPPPEAAAQAPEAAVAALRAAAHTYQDMRSSTSHRSIVVPAEKAETLAPSSGAKRSVGVPADLVAELRRDPAAARKAFLYGEIFGPPLADREEHLR